MKTLLLLTLVLSPRLFASQTLNSDRLPEEAVPEEEVQREQESMDKMNPSVNPTPAHNESSEFPATIEKKEPTPRKPASMPKMKGYGIK